MNHGEFIVNQALVKHHLLDVYEGLERGSLEIARFSLSDIKEILESMDLHARETLLENQGAGIVFAQMAVKMAEDGVRWGW